MGLKVDFQKAIDAIDRCRAEGYSVRWDIFNVAKQVSAKVDDQLAGWSERSKKWAQDTIAILETLFDTPTATYDFLNSKTAWTITGIDSRVSNIIVTIDARLDSLKEQIARLELQQRNYLMQISMGDQSRINLGSVDNSSNTIDRSTTINELQETVDRDYHGADKNEVLTLVEELKKLQNSDSDKHRGREILGTIITKTAEIATIASLAFQLMPFFVK